MSQQVPVDQFLLATPVPVEADVHAQPPATSTTQQMQGTEHEEPCVKTPLYSSDDTHYIPPKPTVPELDQKAEAWQQFFSGGKL